MAFPHTSSSIAPPQWYSLNDTSSIVIPQWYFLNGTSSMVISQLNFLLYNSSITLMMYLQLYIQNILSSINFPQLDSFPILFPQ